jgi:hypothetical protein
MVATHGLLERVIYPPIRILVIALFMANLQQTLTRERAIVSSTNTASVIDAFKGRDTHMHIISYV